jgi:hypothetical protein
MQFIEKNVVDRARFSVGKNHGFSEQLGLRLFEFAKNDGRSHFSPWHRPPI